MYNSPLAHGFSLSSSADSYCTVYMSKYRVGGIGRKPLKYTYKIINHKMYDFIIYYE